MWHVLIAGLLSLSVMPAHADQFTGCVGQAGGISQLQHGDSPLGGECRGKREEIGLASVSRLEVAMDKSATFERVLIEEIGPFRVYATCAEQGQVEPPAFISIESDETMWVSSDTTSGAAGDSVIPPGNFGRATANLVSYRGAPFLLGAFGRTWVAESGAVLHTSVAMMLELTADCTFFGETKLNRLPE
jgi:hypothetical protein